MKKNISILFLLVLICSLHALVVRADTIVTSEGVTINGKITSIVSGLVSITTKDGYKTVYRTVELGHARDVVETGIFRRKKITGEVNYMDSTSIEIRTDSGILNMNRIWVRNIDLSEERN